MKLLWLHLYMSDSNLNLDASIIRIFFYTYTCSNISEPFAKRSEWCLIRSPCFLSQVDEELEALLENGEGLYDEKQVVSLCRLMVRVETMEQKLICLNLIKVRVSLLLFQS